MNKIESPLREILRGYCHVEWFEIEDLREKITHRRIAIDSSLLSSQLLTLKSQESLPIEEINSITSNEFESNSEARAWLDFIYEKVFL
jgi:hypothetical protein